MVLASRALLAARNSEGTEARETVIEEANDNEALSVEELGYRRSASPSSEAPCFRTNNPMWKDQQASNRDVDMVGNSDGEQLEHQRHRSAGSERMSPGSEYASPQADAEETSDDDGLNGEEYEEDDNEISTFNQEYQHEQADRPKQQFGSIDYEPGAERSAISPQGGNDEAMGAPRQGHESGSASASQSREKPAVNGGIEPQGRRRLYKKGEHPPCLDCGQSEGGKWYPGPRGSNTVVCLACYDKRKRAQTLGTDHAPCTDCNARQSPKWSIGPNGPRTICRSCYYIRNRAAAAAREHAPCEVCKETKSTQWRKGPNGRGTLCNPCGIKWCEGQKNPARSSGQG
ncbi:hypothetical protein GE09DRAFT_734758 [Coniochaeta sp. 2T2.1]|nr:hypothetical protein GE09DRAFT_734758 [Coniochaeta sp. 2T2.1]